MGSQIGNDILFSWLATNIGIYTSQDENQDGHDGSYIELHEGTPRDAHRKCAMPCYAYYFRDVEAPEPAMPRSKSIFNMFYKGLPQCCKDGSFDV